MKLLNRFEVSCTVRNPNPVGVPAEETAREYPQNPTWGYLTFPLLVPSPVVVPEVFVKMLDARSIGGNFWFFWGGLSNLDYTVTVIDSVRGVRKSYGNPAYRNPGYQGVDTTSFAADNVPPPVEPRAHHRLLVIPVEFRDWKFKTPQADLVAACEYTTAVWNKEFAGRDEDFTYDLIWPPRFLDRDVPQCDLTWQGKLVQAVKAEGHTGQDFTLGPTGPTCGGRSNATYLQMPMTSLPNTLAHEMGHRLGLDHTSELSNFGQPADAEASYAQPWSEQLEYGDYDLMGAGNTPGFPNQSHLNAHHRRALGLPVDVRLTLARGRWSYLISRWGDAYELMLLGPYKGQWGGGGTRGYIVGNFLPGQRWIDVTGGLPPVTIEFGAGGVVEVKP